MKGGTELVVRDLGLPWREPALRREVAHMRTRGHHGGNVSTHRALLTSPVTAGIWLPAIGLALAFSSAWLLLRFPISRAWAALLDFWRVVIGLGGGVTQVRYDFYGLLRFDVPYLHFGAGLPSNWLWWSGLLLTLGMLILSVLLPRRLLPLVYVLRVFALFQAGAQIFFAFWPHAFPYEASGYVHGMLIAGFMFVSITPLLLGFTYYILDFSLARKIGLTVLLMLHLFVLIPLQYVAHAWVIHHLSLLFLPFVFFVCGLPLQVLAFIAFYAWGVSWRSRLREADPWWETRRGRNGNGNGHGNGNGRRNGDGHNGGHAGAGGPGVGYGTAGSGFGSKVSRTTVVTLIAGAAIAAAIAGAPGSALAQVAPVVVRGGMIEAGVNWSRYSDELGDSDTEFARLILPPRASQQWRFELGREKRFGDESLNFGLMWTRLLRGGASFSLGAARGTGDFIAPDYRLDAGAAIPLGGVLFDPGVTFIRSKADNRSFGVCLGMRRYSGAWLLAAHGRVDFGEPGATTSTLVGGGITYLAWRRAHVDLGGEWGDVSYMLVGPGEALVDYRHHTYHLALTGWLGPRRGATMRLEYGDTPFYTVRGVTLSLFREW